MWCSMSRPTQPSRTSDQGSSISTSRCQICATATNSSTRRRWASPPRATSRRPTPATARAPTPAGRRPATHILARDRRRARRPGAGRHGVQDDVGDGVRAQRRCRVAAGVVRRRPGRGFRRRRRRRMIVPA
ncbi:hypothetical protein GQ55_9G607900 [Panicum hallii var. hallii]|uniref:Uncharacterized protein n=1 Tax=Panicum hallii var. hallii TaxID=1504633 RepID=A0A2T7CHE0_9POAL|nr:hypothetical protein GQ55_9G607900 [Panicum hallii var. hallii]